MRDTLSALTALGLLVATPAMAQGDPSMRPSKACTARSARPVDAGALGADPAALAGQCVKFEGWWRDIAVYPTRAEAAVIDALSIPLLDNRRIGLYLSKADADAAPPGPKLATIVGVVGGPCARLSAAVREADAGYCHYKGGVFVAVSKVQLAK